MQFTFWEMQSYWKEVKTNLGCIYNQFYKFKVIFDAQRQDDYIDMQICLCQIEAIYTSFISVNTMGLLRSIINRLVMNAKLMKSIFTNTSNSALFCMIKD